MQSWASRYLPTIGIGTMNQKTCDNDWIFDGGHLKDYDDNWIIDEFGKIVVLRVVNQELVFCGGWKRSVQVGALYVMTSFWGVRGRLWGLHMGVRVSHMRNNKSEKE